MNHPTDDELLLLVYDELTGARAAEVEAHLAACADCHRQFATTARGRVATESALDRRRGRLVAQFRIAAVGLAAAALIAAILIGRRGSDEPRGVWPRQLEWSTNAGYFAGGRAVIVIDGQLKRLEQGWSYDRP
jgi:anti-sigma factor RsiW